MNEHEFECYKKAGQIASEVKKFIFDYVQSGMKLIDIARAIDSKIVELGGEWGFPVNLSIDKVAAHYTPDPSDDSVASGLLKVDFGVAIDGYIADTAISLDLTEEGRHKDMIDLNQKILNNITQKICKGTEVREVGNTAQDTLEEWNDKNDTSYSIIKSLSGHSLDKDTIHAGLTISNYRNENRRELSNMAFAIEPFVTTGVGDIYEGKGGGIYALQADEPVRDRDAREILRYVKEKFKSRPFCLRWLEGKGFNKLRYVLSMLVKQGILHEYPMLIEKSKAPVSQVENTFVVRGDEVVVSTA